MDTALRNGMAGMPSSAWLQVLPVEGRARFRGRLIGRLWERHWCLETLFYVRSSAQAVFRVVLSVV